MSSKSITVPGLGAPSPLDPSSFSPGFLFFKNESPLVASTSLLTVEDGTIKSVKKTKVDPSMTEVDFPGPGEKIAEEISSSESPLVLRSLTREETSEESISFNLLPS